MNALPQIQNKKLNICMKIQFPKEKNEGSRKRLLKPKQHRNNKNSFQAKSVQALGF